MNEENENLDRWQPCQTGELQRVVQQQKSRRRNTARLKVGGASVALFALIAVGSVILNQVGGMSCTEAQANMLDYISGKADEKLASRLKAHLDECPHCAKQYKRMTEPVSDAVQSGRFSIVSSEHDRAIIKDRLVTAQSPARPRQSKVTPEIQLTLLLRSPANE